MIDEIVFRDAGSSRRQRTLASSRRSSCSALRRRRRSPRRVAVDFFPSPCEQQCASGRVWIDALLDFFSAAAGRMNSGCCWARHRYRLATAAIIVLLCLSWWYVLLVRATSRGPGHFRHERLRSQRPEIYVLQIPAMWRQTRMNWNRGWLILSRGRRPSDSRRSPADSERPLPAQFLYRLVAELWEYLRGDMSPVGPAPAVPDEVEQYMQWQRRRLRMRPGLTCLWALLARQAGFRDLDGEWRHAVQSIIGSLGPRLEKPVATIPARAHGHGGHPKTCSRDLHINDCTPYSPCGLIHWNQSHSNSTVPIILVEGCRVGWDAPDSFARIRQKIGLETTEISGYGIVALPGGAITSTQKLLRNPRKGLQKCEQLSKDLNLTPQQRPNSSRFLKQKRQKWKWSIRQSLSRMQKMEFRSLLCNDQTDPQVKSIPHSGTVS